WASIEEIDVVALHRAAWESRCRFKGLAPMHPIWTSLDSLMLKPGDDQLRRETLEPIPLLRHTLDERHARPYAICETPAFMLTTKKKEEAKEDENRDEEARDSERDA